MLYFSFIPFCFCFCLTNRLVENIHLSEDVLRWRGALGFGDASLVKRNPVAHGFTFGDAIATRASSSMDFRPGLIFAGTLRDIKTNAKELAIRSSAAMLTSRSTSSAA